LRSQELQQGEKRKEKNRRDALRRCTLLLKKLREGDEEFKKIKREWRGRGS